ncbi:hypothetical protein FACS1894167_13630 [Synergistales bacterium]|nr:hypothetical protein FACS1894167_13630 [Synergistales bacterium]
MMRHEGFGNIVFLALAAAILIGVSGGMVLFTMQSNQETEAKLQAEKDMLTAELLQLKEEVASYKPVIAEINNLKANYDALLSEYNSFRETTDLALEAASSRADEYQEKTEEASRRAEEAERRAAKEAASARESARLAEERQKRQPPNEIRYVPVTTPTQQQKPPKPKRWQCSRCGKMGLNASKPQGGKCSRNNLITKDSPNHIWFPLYE